MNPKVERTACAKIILCGEHAVVYGRPAIALPLSHLRTRASVEPSTGPFRICAPDIHAEFDLTTDPARPLAALARLTLEFLRQAPLHARLTVASDIPPSSHLGSSASVAVASARAIAAYCGRELAPEDASALALEAEKVYHGSPSGIDNTVIAYEQPVWFVKGASPSPLWRDARETRGEGQRIPFVIADSGIATPTKIPVGDVRRAWAVEPARYERLFDQVAVVVTASRDALRTADWARLGECMNVNHALLQQLGVSSAELDHLCNAARGAGALGAKLSGGGRGGNMIALARDDAHVDHLKAALCAAGATRVM